MRRAGRVSRWTLWRRRRTSDRATRSKCGLTERLRFQDFRFERLTSGKCRARVVLGWTDGRGFVGESDGVISQTGELRGSAAAAVKALDPALAPPMRFELLAAKAVRASDPTAALL